MTENQLMLEIEPIDLLNQVHQYKDQGYRLVQICCTKLVDGLELNYSFAKEYQFVNLRFQVDPDTEIHSISSVFEPAFLYENEMHDLFGLKVVNLSLDYHGELYRLHVKTPFNVPTVENPEGK